MYSDLKEDLFETVVAPDYKAELQDVVRWRHRWRKTSNYSEGAAHLILGAATMLAFSAGFFENAYLTFAAACSNTLCLVLLRFAAYAEGESTERHAILSRMLHTVGIDPMPAITARAQDDGARSQERDARRGGARVHTSSPAAPAAAQHTAATDNVPAAADPMGAALDAGWQGNWDVGGAENLT